MDHTAELPNASQPDNDPRLWLEEVDGERATKWAEEETACTLRSLDAAALQSDKEAMKEAMDNPDRIPQVLRRGGLLYNFWKDSTHKRGLWRRCTPQSYRTESPEWEDLLDLDKLNDKEDADWVWIGTTTLPPAHDRALLKLSRGGSDATVIREFDLSQKAFVDGFTLPEAKSDAEWLDKDTLLFASADPGRPDLVTKSGYARAVQIWRRDTDPKTAPVIFEVSVDHVRASMDVDRTVSPPRIIYTDMRSFWDKTRYLGTERGPEQELKIPHDAADYSIEGNHLIVRPRKDWTVGGHTRARDTVVLFDLDKFLKGEQESTVMFEPGPRLAIDSLHIVAGHAVMSILDNLQPIIKVTDLAERTEKTVSGLPRVANVLVRALDELPEESDGSLRVDIDNPITPRTCYLSSVHDTSLTLLRQAPSLFDSSGLTVTQLEAIADDGERIPYVLTGRRESTGKAYVYMTGYGGFTISTKPYYDYLTGLLWLARGGCSVTCNIRGGGEFGTRWHEAGLLERKIVAQDDFAAIARDLVKRGITVPGRIAAEGLSNGGLLIGNMFTRHPADFGALLCRIPLADMKRYSKLLAGASWMGEFGDPDKAEDWEHISKISTYHNVGRPTARTPPMLITTSRRDDRVHPGHARKLAAKLRDLGHETLFYEISSGGHGPGTDNEQAAFSTALGFLFLRQSIGWS